MINRSRIFYAQFAEHQTENLAPNQRFLGELDPAPLRWQGETLAWLRDHAHTSFMLADEQTSREQFALLRAMSGQRRLKVAEQLYWSARKLKAAGVRRQHPDWPEERVSAEVGRLFLHARS